MDLRTDMTTRPILALILLVLILQLANQLLFQAQPVMAESGKARYQISAYGTRWGSGYYLVNMTTGEITSYHHRPKAP